MRIADCVAGVAFLGFSLLYYFAALELPFSPSYGDPGPAELPKLAAVVCGIVAVALIVQGVKSAPGGVGKLFSSRSAVFVLWSIGATVALPYLHTLPTLAIYIFGGILIQSGKSGLRLALICAPLISGLVYALFQPLLGVPLP